jgi:hypothetical protein
MREQRSKNGGDRPAQRQNHFFSQTRTCSLNGRNGSKISWVENTALIVGPKLDRAFGDEESVVSDCVEAGDGRLLSATR